MYSMKANQALGLIFSKIRFYLTRSEHQAWKKLRKFFNNEVISAGKPRIIAFYLPQFHPIPENDAWWGKGFTEWTNVTRAKPLFRGHYQPNLPSELGFYDLRLPEVRDTQAELARSYGLEGFCYWHYWFGNGRRLLERPFQEVLESGKPDFPFCIAWANESWTGRWHGLDDRILAQQEYPGENDFTEHFYALKKAFSDPRYIKVNGKNLFLVYWPFELPDPSGFVRLWRKLAEAENLPGFYFIGINQNPFVRKEHLPDLTGGLYDGYIINGPNLPEKTIFPTFAELLLHRLTGINLRLILRAMNYTGPEIYQYSSFARNSLNSLLHEREYPLLIPGWDNTPRSGRNGMVLKGSTPLLFQRLLKKAINLMGARPEQEKLIFIKSWNEWAEGNYMEPDMQWGRKYLEAVKDVTDI